MAEIVSNSSSPLRVLGICVGASTISVVQIEKPAVKGIPSKPNSFESVRVTGHLVEPHGGNPKAVLPRILSEFNPENFDRVAVTGRRFRQFLDLSSISEPEAVEYAYRFLKPPDVHCPAIVSAGGETFMVYLVNRKGEISNVLTGNKCASGTGEFFMQQLRRMGATLDQAAQWSENELPHSVSGRCSVFCKSDCTHAINKGIPKSRVTAGLCRMMAGKILELLKKVERKNIMIVGGSSRNHMMIRYLKEEIENIIIPEQAPYFEALGTALWALTRETRPFPGMSRLINSQSASFDPLPPLKDYQDRVTFKSMPMQTVKPGDICILGLDVGSTTTKAVLMRKSDKSMLASVYRLTAGDPVGASRDCYRQILAQVKKSVDPNDIAVIGLGVCGSGRQIAGLHALTEGILNEIIAHAAAAVHFDPEVDTLFEIGGQDAKYTYITAGVPSDYAMNEACSAGTGSFLEESAYETLGIKVTDIAYIAVTGAHPPNFNDQCAAFIASDIKIAIHEGIDHGDIIAGLVYSICMNYINRVKGNRPVGEKVFMQGGVCYNHAVPLAMAALSGKPIIVPPEPGLMGAYGAALEIGKRIDLGLMKESRFDLEQLAGREVTYHQSFTCGGGKEKCDRRCEINLIELEGKKYPFGGACNRYYNLRFNIKVDVSRLDLVKTRERIIFDQNKVPSSASGAKTVAVNKSFLTNTYYPLYALFFTELGFSIIYPEQPSREGIDQRNAAFCHPAELSHGFFRSILDMKPPPDYIFLPHIRSIPVKNGNPISQVCPFVQGEPYFLNTTFKSAVESVKRTGTRMLTPLIDMTRGVFAAGDPMIRTAQQMGVSRSRAAAAFENAAAHQRRCMAQMKNIGRDVLSELEADPDRMAVVIFGRPYNAMVEEAHMGIPHKLASRGVKIIPFDFLPCDDEPSKRHMYWGMGQLLLKAARFVKKHPQLYATFITNFSCGPDSFIITYFRSIMGRKPSLTLELDSHTADAGIETRIEAFLDIVAQYRQLESRKRSIRPAAMFTPSTTFMNNGIPKVRTSDGQTVYMSDPRVTLLIPSMGRISTEAISSVFRAAGFHVMPHPPADEVILKLGRANTSCKECLPLILTTGTLLHYIRTRKKPGEILVYFMATASGPCRFGQYAIFMEDLIRRLEIPDVAIFSLTSDNTYSDLGRGFSYYKAWWAVIISDVLEDLRSMLLANAVDPEAAMEVFESEWQKILNTLEKENFKGMNRQLGASMERLGKISMKRPPGEVPRILLTGEIFVRRDSLSRQHLTEHLAKNGFAVVCSPVAEWIRYSDYMLPIDGHWKSMPLGQKIKFHIRQMLMNRYEQHLIRITGRTGLVEFKPAHIKTFIENASNYISEHLSGEAVLTVGASLTEVASDVCGVIAIGPFGCMPNRLSEAILNEAMSAQSKLATRPEDPRLKMILSDVDDLPFLAIESDGSPFPQLINAKLEAFCLRARRLHDKMSIN